MSNSSTTSGQWKLLLLDTDPADPKWLLATVAEPGDVRPARPGENTLDEVTDAWVRARVGHPAALTAMPPRAHMARGRKAVTPQKGPALRHR